MSITRRLFCKSAAVAAAGAVGGALLAGCAGAEQPAAAPSPETENGSAQQTEPTAPAPEPAQEAPSADGPSFDFASITVPLNNGVTMPILGIGTFRLSSSVAEESTYNALASGFRLIDTARIYGNEDGVGRGVRRAIEEGIVGREDVFVTTKMWTDDYHNGDAAVNASLERLGLDYADLMILHHSAPGSDVQAYQAMENALNDGRLRAIGLSNYYTPEDFDRLVGETTVLPALLQNEAHPYCQGAQMKDHLQQYGTVFESWYPLGGRGNTQVLFGDQTVSDLAERHGKTPAQVLLRWHLQAGNIAIPGSGNAEHIQEDFALFDFELSEEDMQRIAALDRNQRFSTY